MPDLFKNTILVLILFSVIVIGITPRSSHAFWGVEDIVFDPQGFVEWVISALANYGQLLLDNFIQYVWKVLLEEFKLKILDIMNQQVVKWVTTGESGSPKFIQNWETYLVGSFNVGYYSVGGELRAAPVCDQFKNDVIKSGWATVNWAGDTNSVFINRMSCTLDPLLTQLGTTRVDYQNDFRNGGWLAYSEQLMHPQNNFMGAYLMASDEASTRGLVKQNASQQQGVASQGYIPVKRCVEDLGPGQAGPSQCGRYQVTSPASVFESAINAGIKGRFDYIVNADQMVQLVLIIADSFVNNLIKSGVDGLFNYGSGNSPSGGYIDSTKANCNNQDPSLCAVINAGANPPIAGKQDGEACVKDLDCKSLMCGPAGVCIEAQPAGSTCTQDRQCESNICGPSGTCSSPISNGSRCTNNSQCQSFFCSPTTLTCDNAPNITPIPGSGNLGQPCLPGNGCNQGTCFTQTNICI